MIDAEQLPGPRTFGDVETVFAFARQMPTGVAVSDDWRIFVCYPRWGDDVRFTVAELRDGEEIPYPDAALNAFDGDDAAGSLVSVQSVAVAPAGRLWLLDTGSIEMQPTVEGGPKLVRIDREDGSVAQMIVLPRDVALEKTYLNDVRFDLDRGVAFITDSGT